MGSVSPGVSPWRRVACAQLMPSVLQLCLVRPRPPSCSHAPLCHNNLSPLEHCHRPPEAGSLLSSVPSPLAHTIFLSLVPPRLHCLDLPVSGKVLGPRHVCAELSELGRGTQPPKWLPGLYSSSVFHCSWAPVSSSSGLLKHFSEHSAPSMACSL